MSEPQEVEAKVWRRGAGWLPVEAAMGSAEVAPVAAPAVRLVRDAATPIATPARGADSVATPTTISDAGKVTAFRDFSDNDLAVARETLLAIDEAAAADLRVARALGRAEDGRFVIGLRVPRYPLSPENQAQPWNERVMGSDLGMAFDLRWFPLADGVALVRSDACPEVEVVRRESLQADRMAAARAQLAREQAEREAKNGREIEEQRAREARGLESWQTLPAWVRLCHRLAAVFRERDPQLASEIAAIARNVNRAGGGDRVNGPDLPDVEWRR